MKFNHSNLLSSFSNLSHAYTTRECSNLAFHVNDDKNQVYLNHKYLANKLNYDLNRLVHMKQIHSNIVHVVNENDDFNNPPTCDALITDKKNIPLMVMVADCSPILFYDKKQKVIAVAHAGRAGAFKNIIKNTLECFKNNFASKLDDIYLSIGANIKSCCYEVGDEIFKKAKELNFDYAVDKKNNSCYLDINKILKKQLLAEGIKKNHIEICDECSCCNDKYFSYRADSKCGRFAGVLMLK